MIRQAISRSLAEKSRLIRLPVYLSSAVNKIVREEALHTGPRHSPPAGRDRERYSEEVRMALKASPPPLSLSSPLGEDDSTLGDFLEDRRSESPVLCDSVETLRKRLEEVMKGLDDRECAVIRHRFGVGTEKTWTLAELAGKLNLSRERVRQIEIEALIKLRHPARSRKLEGFLD